MTESDRTDLRAFRAELSSVVQKLKNFHDRGFQVNFSLNGVKGELEDFKVVQTIPVDIDKKAN